MRVEPVVKKLERFYAKATWLDLALCSVGLFAWGCWGFPLPPFDDMTFPAAISSFAGIASAVATFACTFMWESTSRFMEKVRKVHVRQLSSNWVSIVGGMLLAAALPIVAMIFWDSCRRWACGLSFLSLAYVLLKTIRCIHWLKYTFSMDVYDKEVPKAITDKDFENL